MPEQMNKREAWGEARALFGEYGVAQARQCQRSGMMEHCNEREVHGDYCKGRRMIYQVGRIVEFEGRQFFKPLGTGRSYNQAFQEARRTIKGF